MSKNASRDGAIARGLDYFDSGKFEEELAQRVAVHTESQRPEGLPELHRYIKEEMIPAFTEMGFECRVYENPFEGCGPFLLAERHEGDDLPTVLGYGHGDVIQGLDELWTKGKGPWVTARDGDKIYGRGTADNKGQHTLNMAAMRAVIEERGQLGFNAKALIEMGEENGSKGLREIIGNHASDFAADTFIGSDGPRVKPDLPTVTLGNRGSANFDLVVNLREGGHHSGNWGGLLASPGTILSHALASIVDANGAIQVKEWLPPQITNSVRMALKDIEIEAGADGPEIDPSWGQPGLTPAEKVYAWNSFEILALKIGTPERPVNAIPGQARAHCQLRFVVGTDEEDILPALRRHLEAHGFDDVQVELPPAANAIRFAASRTDVDHPWAKWVCASVERSTGKPPAVIPSMGGSIGNDIFTDILGLPTIWIPHSYAACSQHAPDEHILASGFRSGMEIMTGLYWDLGEDGTPARA
ncbi:MAG: M20 family metallopeptidase [Hyphomicrobiales bacterium]|nr:M20 family metallopeptidase [Hyphomicrobiales bacterium]